MSVNYHAINDFRSDDVALTDELLTDNVAALATTGAISLERVAQDGMRMRANAGAASSRREASLQENLSQARELVQTLKTQAETDPALASRREQAAKQRAARELEDRISQALAQLPEVAAAKRCNGARGEDASSSTTDAQARVMKMGDRGGLRSAYNVQFATTCHGQVIVGMAVVNAGSDMAQLAPVVEQVQQRLGQAPEQWLVDGGFRGGPVMPDSCDGSAQRLAAPGGNVLKAGIVGSLMANDQRWSMVFVPLLDTDKPLDCRALSRSIEAKVRKLEGGNIRVHVVGFAKLAGDRWLARGARRSPAPCHAFDPSPDWESANRYKLRCSV